LDSQARYIHTSRDIAEFVHRDYPYLTFVNACLILLSYGPQALDPANPYLSAKTQIGFPTFGASDVLDLVARVANEALKAAWYQKWLVHRRLRPEEFGGWIDNQKNNRASYPLDSEILNSPVLNQVFNRYGSYLLPQAFPEGCPTHPAYPSGHATYAGACVTVLKAFFNADFPIPQPMVASDDGLKLLPYTRPDSLTVGGELNKLAANIAIARNAAGVHWRTDATEGLKLGEAVAICLLADRKTLYNEPFKGFTLTKFDNSKVLT
jgi:membrane-associated phospholipid phosphatase